MGYWDIILGEKEKTGKDGRRQYFKGTPNQQTSKPPNQQTSKPANQQTSKPANRR